MSVVRKFIIFPHAKLVINQWKVLILQVIYYVIQKAREYLSTKPSSDHKYNAVI